MDTAEKIVDLKWVTSLYNEFAQELVSTCEGGLKPVKFTGTDSKLALIEIIYALKAKGSFKHGTATLKDIADAERK